MEIHMEMDQDTDTDLGVQKEPNIIHIFSYMRFVMDMKI
jgi:hypothetical protein